MKKEVRNKRFLVCSRHFLVLLLGKCLKSVHCFVGSILIEDLNNLGRSTQKVDYLVLVSFQAWTKKL